MDDTENINIARPVVWNLVTGAHSTGYEVWVDNDVPGMMRRASEVLTLRQMVPLDHALTPTVRILVADTELAGDAMLRSVYDRIAVDGHSVGMFITLWITKR